MRRRKKRKEEGEVEKLIGSGRHCKYKLNNHHFNTNCVAMPSRIAENLNMVIKKLGASPGISFKYG